LPTNCAKEETLISRSTTTRLRRTQGNGFVSIVTFSFGRQYDEKWAHQIATAKGFGIGVAARMNGGRYRIRTYDFHRVRMALYR
jgi:hypothetical protein